MTLVPDASHQNVEVLLVIESPQLAAHFTREMDRLWRGAELGINPRLAGKLGQTAGAAAGGLRGVRGRLESPEEAQMD